ncbi:iron-sulfur cluster repair di-iron protein, ric [Streptococcus uberis]|uniref:iron-sulfur cluster repair di-iron protein, ric n=1 Tax=Streptococcus uberis TaxID=1349 RepID=UPI0012B541BF|nr:iron-sulfur cluster repair di-iron protein, ric [Streptococcus uberis]MTB69525.1 iron-sulfur cluster repair di-iron protein, ric [Streptococcus uberis]
MLKEFFEKNDEMLDLYTNAITKAHGKNHPEVFEVRRSYQAIQAKMQQNQLDLAPEFGQIRLLTNDYAIPNDACPTLTKTYQILEEFDILSQK